MRDLSLLSVLQDTVSSWTHSLDFNDLAFTFRKLEVEGAITDWFTARRDVFRDSTSAFSSTDSYATIPTMFSCTAAHVSHAREIENTLPTHPHAVAAMAFFAPVKRLSQSPPLLLRLDVNNQLIRSPGYFHPPWSPSTSLLSWKRAQSTRRGYYRAGLTATCDHLSIDRSVRLRLENAEFSCSPSTNIWASYHDGNIPCRILCNNLHDKQNPGDVIPLQRPSAVSSSSD
jgi:hypothetical protein